MIRPLLLSLLSASLLATPALAEDFFGAVETSSPAPAPQTTSPVAYKAWVQQKAGYGYRSPAPGFSRDGADLTRFETRVYAQVTGQHSNWHWQVAGSLSHDWLADFDSAGLWSGYTLTNEQQEERRWQWQMDDSYLAWQSEDWWIKAGYQTLAWGEAESLKATDVVARRDQRWPGQEDLEQLRLPSPALLLSWRNQLELAALVPLGNDSRFDRQAVGFDEFDPLVSLRNPDAPQPDIHLQERHQPGWALRWRHSSPGRDIQLIAADIYSFEPTLASFTLIEPPVAGDDEPYLGKLEFAQDRQQVLGFAIQQANGNWLLKTEQAWHQSVRLQPANPLADWQDYDQWRSVLALEYSGIQDLTLSAETSSNYTPDWNDSLADRKWQSGHALRLRYTLFNERLTLGSLVMRTSGDQGDILRLTVDWQVDDELTVGITLVEYQAQAERQRLHRYRHNDALLLNLRLGL